MGTNEEKNRLTEKLRQAEGKAKKYIDGLKENKRQQKLISDKNKQIEQL